jgi:hypothetical protein
MSDSAPQPSVPAVDQKGHPTKQLLREWIAHRLRYLLLALCCVVVLSFAGRLNWLFDNLSAFVLQYAAIAALFAVLFLVLKAPRRALLSLVLAVVLGVRLWRPSYEATAAGPTFEIVTANVKTSNREFDRFLHFVRRESPDVLVVIEIDNGWAAALESLSRTSHRQLRHRPVEPYPVERCADRVLRRLRRSHNCRSCGLRRGRTDHRRGDASVSARPVCCRR